MVGPLCACGVRGKFICVRCGKVRYCSKKCQTDDWALHKSACRPANVYTGLIRVSPVGGGMYVDLGIITVKMDPSQRGGWGAALTPCMSFRKEVYTYGNAFSYSDNEGPSLSVLSRCRAEGTNYGQLRRDTSPRVKAEYVNNFLCANMVHFWHMLGWTRQYSTINIIPRTETGTFFVHDPVACHTNATKKCRPVVGMKAISLAFPIAAEAGGLQTHAILEILAALPAAAVEHIKQLQPALD